jgi:Rod binding domain-containing protein
MEQVKATSSLPASRSAGPAATQPKAVGPQRPRDSRLWKAATDFQEIMLSQFTQAMRATDKDNGLVEQCPGSDTFDQMFSDAIAHEMSQSGALGLNKTIYRAMGGTYEKMPALRSMNGAPAAANPQVSAGRVVPAKLPPRIRGAGAGIQVETAE